MQTEVEIAFLLKHFVGKIVVHSTVRKKHNFYDAAIRLIIRRMIRVQYIDCALIGGHNIRIRCVE